MDLFANSFKLTRDIAILPQDHLVAACHHQMCWQVLLPVMPVAFKSTLFRPIPQNISTLCRDVVVEWYTAFRTSIIQRASNTLRRL
jgi:hypothetical protein